MARQWLLATTMVLCLVYLTSADSSASTTSNNNSGSRQGVASALTGSGILSAIGSLLPSAFTSVIPMMLLFGMGALMVPALGLGMLLREGRRSDPGQTGAYATHPLAGKMPNTMAGPGQPNPVNGDHAYHYYRSLGSFNVNTAALLDGFTDLMEKVMKALDNAQKKYN